MKAAEKLKAADEGETILGAGEMVVGEEPSEGERVGESVDEMIVGVEDSEEETRQGSAETGKKAVEDSEIGLQNKEQGKRNETTPMETDES